MSEPGPRALGRPAWNVSESAAVPFYLAAGLLAAALSLAVRAERARAPGEPRLAI